jgi:hypothetical protein
MLRIVDKFSVLWLTVFGTLVVSLELLLHQANENIVSSLNLERSSFHQYSYIPAKRLCVTWYVHDARSCIDLLASA